MNTKLSTKITFKALREIYAHKGYEFFTGKMNLNIFGVRSSEMQAGKFNDIIGFSWYCPQQKKGELKLFSATTDPGLYYLHNPMKIEGTLIMAPGQYKGAYIIGYHNGQYLALRQSKNINYYRDANRDNILDMQGHLQSGLVHANIHRASAWHINEDIGRYSAGCQVIQDPNDFRILINAVLKSSGLYGELFTYTLLEEKNFDNYQTRFKAIIKKCI